MKRRFTLLELLLAFTVLLVLLTMLSLSFRTVRNSWQNMERNAARIERIERMNYFADNYLRNLTRLVVPLETGGAAEQFLRGGANFLTAVAMGRSSSAAKPGISFFDLRLNDVGELILITSPSPFVPAELRRATDVYTLPKVAEQTVLADQVKNFTVSYGELQNGLLTWADEWSGAQGLPAAILLRIEYENGEKEAILRRIGGIQGGTAPIYRQVSL